MSDTQDSSSEPRVLTRDDILKDDPLREFFVWWDDITSEDVAAYELVLDAAEDEKPLQRHLQEEPLLLVQHFGGGHGRWVIPQRRLGAEFVPDFVIGERYSGGLGWELVELQSPRARLFTKAGRQSEHLDEGIRQILEWRRWLGENKDYAQRPQHRQGLGIMGISDRSDGLLLIGREHDLTDLDKERRKQLGYDHRIKIHTYDWVIREARRRLWEIARHPLLGGRDPDR